MGSPCGFRDMNDCRVGRDPTSASGYLSSNLLEGLKITLDNIWLISSGLDSPSIHCKDKLQYYMWYEGMDAQAAHIVWDLFNRLYPSWSRERDSQVTPGHYYP